MRISEPLPALRPVRAWKSAAAALKSAARTLLRPAAEASRRAAAMTALVWAPTSLASAAQAVQARTIMVSAAGKEDPASDADSSSAWAIGMAMDVSSVHSAGANPNGPPPFMVTSAPSGSGAPNS